MRIRTPALILAALLLCTAAAQENVFILPGGTKVVEVEAFRDTITNGRLVLPEGIEEIQSRAFANCSLTEINLPQSLRFIADDAFAGCDGAKFIAREGSYAHDWALENGQLSFTTVEDGVLTFLVGPDSAVVTDCAADAVEVVIPQSIGAVPVTGIGEYAFESCESLERISLPECIERIEPFAFYECTALAEIEIPAGVNALPDSAFRGCRSLSAIALHPGLASIGYMCFEDCWNLASISLPEGLIEIGPGAFSNCQGLQKVTMPESLTTIGGSAFASCIAIERLVIPRAVNSIGENAFRGCNLTAVVDAGAFPRRQLCIALLQLERCSLRNLLNCLLPMIFSNASA